MTKFTTNGGCLSETKKRWHLIESFLVLVLLFIITFVQAQDPPQYGTPFSNVPDTRDVNMYQVHIRPFSAAGNFAGVTARLDSIKSLGINVIYLMPIYPHGTDARSTASPYCIKDYKSIASEYGTLADLRTLVDGAHSRNMAVVLDIAINGTSWDHPWISQHPDWYIQNNGIIQQLGSFADVAALNFNNTSMRAALVDAMRYWIFAANIDGYRCDYANNPPVDFWTNTINNLRSITTHKLLMFAEGDRQQNFTSGFDMNFGFDWYNTISSIAGGASVTGLQAVNDAEYANASASQQFVRYTYNHDLETSATALQIFGGHAGVVVNFLVCAYMRGVPFLTSGQETDFNQTIPWPYQTVKINWNTNPSASTDFRKIFNYRTNSTAVRRGTMENYSGNNVCAFTKTNGSEKIVVMANLRNSTQNYNIPSALAGNYKDAYSGAVVTLTSGTTQSLAAFAYRVLTNVGACTPTTITPYLQINGGSWQQTAIASLAAGGTIKLGPQPLGGTWKWTGPNGYTSTSREITISNIQTNQGGNYIATYTNSSGCNSTQTFSITVTGGTVAYYNIQNRWHTEYYLYDGGNGQVKYGTNPGSNTLYQWTRVATGSYVLLKNRSTGNLMHVENQNGSVQCNTADPTWYSAQWTVADAGGGYNYIQNRWQPNEWVHIENLLGYAQYANMPNGWYSAMWQFVNQTNGFAATATTLPESKSSQLRVYPNPVTENFFYVSLPSLAHNEQAMLSISNSDGKVVLVKTISSAQARIIHHLPAGTYFITMHTKKIKLVQKLIIQ